MFSEGFCCLSSRETLSSAVICFPLQSLLGLVPTHLHQIPRFFGKESVISTSNLSSRTS